MKEMQRNERNAKKWKGNIRKLAKGKNLWSSTMIQNSYECIVTIHLKIQCHNKYKKIHCMLYVFLVYFCIFFVFCCTCNVHRSTRKIHENYKTCIDKNACFYTGQNLNIVNDYHWQDSTIVLHKNIYIHR